MARHTVHPERSREAAKSRESANAAANLALLISLLVSSGCARAAADAEATSTIPREARDRGVLAEGKISFYGEWFRGKLTANGEKFDPDAMTAAHKTLKFGACLVVENLENGKRVKVRVNDRGPYVRGRILDVSLGAARALGMVDRGVVRARLWRCDKAR